MDKSFLAKKLIEVPSGTYEVETSEGTLTIKKNRQTITITRENGEMTLKIERENNHLMEEVYFPADETHPNGYMIKYEHDKGEFKALMDGTNYFIGPGEMIVDNKTYKIAGGRLHHKVSDEISVSMALQCFDSACVTVKKWLSQDYYRNVIVNVGEEESFEELIERYNQWAKAKIDELYEAAATNKEFGNQGKSLMGFGPEYEPVKIDCWVDGEIKKVRDAVNTYRANAHLFDVYHSPEVIEAIVNEIDNIINRLEIVQTQEEISGLQMRLATLKNNQTKQ